MEYFLWQLYHIDQEMRRERREQQQHRQALAHLQKNVDASDAEVASHSLHPFLPTDFDGVVPDIQCVSLISAVRAISAVPSLHQPKRRGEGPASPRGRI